MAQNRPVNGLRQSHGRPGRAVDRSHTQARGGMWQPPACHSHCPAHPPISPLAESEDPGEVLSSHILVELQVMGGCSDAGDIRFAVAGEVADNAIGGGDSRVQHRVLPSLAP